MSEAPEARAKRLRQRVLFDTVADRYDAARSGYPDELVSLLPVAAGEPVLEVGCGTGQLTASLVARGLDVTAIDIGPSMVDAASRRVPGARFEVSSFEEFDASPASFALVVSATAFHWIDPEVRFTKAARVLRPGGWLAVLTTGERYDEPFGPALLHLWVERSDDGGAFARERRQTMAGMIASSGLFEPAVEHVHRSHEVLPAGRVLELETTRGTWLDYPPDVRAGFTDALRSLLAETSEVGFVQESTLTVARLAG